MATQPLYPNRYVWFVFVSTLDVLMTFVILSIGGREANSIANAILERFGIGGLTIFKFILVTFVILLCEVIGRKDEPKGRRLAEWGIALTCVPVVISFALLFIDLSRNS